MGCPAVLWHRRGLVLLPVMFWDVSSQGCPDELPFLVRPQSTVRVEGTAFRISSGFRAAIYMCPLEGCPKQARQMASRCIPVNSG